MADRSSQHADGCPSIELDHVSFTYPPGGFASSPVEALKDITLVAEQSTKLGILGPNGGGKSTLIKLILGILKPTAGTIKVLGRSPVEARRQGLVGYLPQRIDAHRDWPISVRQVVALGCSTRLKPWQRLGTSAQGQVDQAIEYVELQALADRPIGALSGGQLQRVMIARAIACQPKLLILDEPTVGVDIPGQQRFGKLIDTLHRELGISIVVVSHDMRAIAAVADRIACLSKTLHFHDAPDGLTPAVLAQVFAHDVAGVFGEIHIDAHRAQDCETAEQTPDECACTHTPCDQSRQREEGQ